MENSFEAKKSWIDEYHNGVRYGLKGKILIEEETITMNRFMQISGIKKESDKNLK